MYACLCVQMHVCKMVTRTHVNACLCVHMHVCTMWLCVHMSRRTTPRMKHSLICVHIYKCMYEMRNNECTITYEESNEGKH